jgi:hypothetical protein
MKAATRMRASCRGRRLGVSGDVLAGDVLAGDVLAGDVLAGDVLGGDVLAGDVLGGDVLGGVVSADAAAGMIPIRYVTDRFGFPEGRTGP